MAAQPGLSGRVSRIRCMLPGPHGVLFKSMPDGVRIPAVFRTPEQFGEIAAHPETDEGIIPASPRPALAEPNAESEPFIPLRIPDARVSMRDEMVTARDYDYGRIRAMAVRDRSDRTRIHGFVRIPTVWGVRFEPPVNLRSAPIMLAEAVNRYTDIEASMDGHLMLTDRRLFSTPFLYITAESNFDLTREERERLGIYLHSGGFVFLEDGEPRYESGPAGTAMKWMLRDALGCHARLEPIPSSHPLYHSVFDFDDGLPQGDISRRHLVVTTGDAGSTMFSMLRPQNTFLEGVFINGSLVAVYSKSGYGAKWALNNYTGMENNSPQMRFAANLVVYALTRKGGITDKVMERFVDMQ